MDRSSPILSEKQESMVENLPGCWKSSETVEAMCCVMQWHSRVLMIPSQNSANFSQNHEPTTETSHWCCVPCNRRPLPPNTHANILRKLGAFSKSDYLFCFFKCGLKFALLMFQRISRSLHFTLCAQLHLWEKNQKKIFSFVCLGFPTRASLQLGYTWKKNYSLNSKNTSYGILQTLSPGLNEGSIKKKLKFKKIKSNNPR